MSGALRFLIPAADSDPMTRPGALAVPVMLVVVVLFSGCSVFDSDARSRDRAAERAQEVARELELPPGYEIAQLEHLKAETPNENRGPGQLGSAYIEVTHDQLVPTMLEEFDEFLTSRDFVAYMLPGDRCLEDQFKMHWLSPEQVLVGVNYLEGSEVGYVQVPYSYEGLLQVPDEPGLFPECPG